MRIRLSALCLAIAGVAAAATGQVRNGTFEITPFYGYLFGGNYPYRATTQFSSNVDVDGAGVYGVGVGYFLNNTFEIEARWAETMTGFVNHDWDHHSSNNNQRLADLQIDYILGYGTFNFGHSRWVPYFTVGMGAAIINPGPRTDLVCPAAQCGDRPSSTHYTTAIGGGVKYYFNRHFGLKLDARDNITYLNSINNGSCPSHTHCGDTKTIFLLNIFETSGWLVISF
jgi:hypothetical protein